MLLLVSELLFTQSYVLVLVSLHNVFENTRLISFSICSQLVEFRKQSLNACRSLMSLASRTSTRCVKGESELFIFSSNAVT